MGGDPNWSADARSVFALCLPGNKTHMERVLLALAALVAAGCGVVHQDAREPPSSDAAGWIVVPAETLTGQPGEIG
jgi:hypothetical protein